MEKNIDCDFLIEKYDYLFIDTLIVGRSALSFLKPGRCNNME